MEGDREAVSFVADQLHQVQHRRVMIERDRLALLAVDVNNLLALGDRRQRLVDNLEGLERLGGGVQLAESTVDQDQAGHFLSLSLLKTLVAARDHLAHGGEIVHADHVPDDELAIVRLLHLAVFPHHHGSHRLRSLDVRNVETFDASRQLRQPERVLQRLLDRFHVRLHHAKTLVVRLLGIVAGQIEQRPLVSALRHQNMYPC